MANSETKTKTAGAEIARQHEHMRKNATPVSANRFSPLELEESYEYFPLLQLPQELCDAILDYTTVQTDTEANDLSESFLSIIEILADKHGARRQMTAKTPTKRNASGQKRGVLAMPSVGKQMHEEMQAAVSRTMPHHVHAHLIKSPAGNGAIKLRRELFKFFPTSVRRLYIENTHHTQEPCCNLHQETTQIKLLAADGLKEPRKYLHSCMVNGEHAWSTPGGCIKIMDALVTIVESLPPVRQYYIRTCEQSRYAKRRNDPTGGDRGAPRYDKDLPLAPAGEGGEWEDFLDRMAVQSRRRRYI